MTYGVSDILELSKTKDFTFSITQFFIDHYGFNRTKKILTSLRKPVKNYAIRVNTLKTDQNELIELLRDENASARLNEQYKDIICFKVKGPYEMTNTDKYVIADKFRR